MNLRTRVEKLEATEPDGPRVVFYLPHNGRQPFPVEPQTGQVVIYLAGELKGADDGNA